MGKDEAFPDSVKDLISASYDPVYKFHQGFLKEVEQRLAQWSVSCLFPLRKLRTPLHICSVQTLNTMQMFVKYV